MIDTIGLKDLYDRAVHLTFLSQQYSPEHERSLAIFTPLDWENLGRVVSTYLFGSFTKYTLDGFATRNSLYLIDHLQDKVDCILAKGSPSDCKEMVQYEMLLMHDLNILSLLKQLNLQ